MTNNVHNIDIHYNNGTGIQHQSNTVVNPYANQYARTNQNAIDEDTKSPHIRLNGLDSAILEEESYRNLDDEILKIEYQITKLNDELNMLEKELSQAKQIEDYQRIDILTIKKRNIEKKLKLLHDNYKDSDISTQLSDNISALFAYKPKGIGKFFSTVGRFVEHNILGKVFDNVGSAEDIRMALSKLETLNKNVDELVTMQAPYGEADERYEMLTEYLNRANVIHYNISKTIGTPTFFDTISSIDKEKLKQAQKEKSNFGNMTGKKSAKIN